ncbi:MAG: sodium/glutamate symporter [Lactimicrobium massiliense]|nr:sodium/glutamate symporter [Lactimicrobium massiliense]MDD6561280.1 sodium/glutamate symporter [Lactimicrobium massiliense]
MISLTLDRYQTMAVAVIVLAFGSWLRKKIPLLERFCIPSPVAGGLVFSILTCILYVSGIAEISFDSSLSEVAMVLFFTSVGFQANVRVLKEGGKDLFLFLVLVIILITAQNSVAVGLSRLLHIDALIGLCTGSIPMVGGHGTAGAFGPVLEDFGITGATTIATAAATFGLIMGSLMGGPLANGLITKKHLQPKNDAAHHENIQETLKGLENYPNAVFALIVCAGIGTILSWLLSKTGMTFPIYIGAMIAAAIFRNIAEISGKFTIHMEEIDSFGSICLSIFLGIAMITLKIWQLADLALPLVILLIGQTALMFVYARFIVFKCMGSDYDAAVIAAGVCGFGMGATPNAMANMQAVREKHGESIKAFLLIPIVGSLFADFINSLIITIFINLI